MGKIWIAGVGFDVDAKVVRWDDGPKFNARSEFCINPHQTCGNGGRFPYSEKKPVSRSNRVARRPALRSLGDNPTMSAAQAVVRQFILHHDGCPDAASCFNVLHNERGLSCHFLLDNDGTIYQTLDLAWMGFHAAGFNAYSVGIEMSNRGDAKKWPTFYSKKGQARETTTCRIHDHTYLAFQYTKQQYEALEKLVRGLARALPNMPIDYPQQSPGYQAWGEITNANTYAGLLGHYHTTRRKWDPGPFDFKAFCENARGSKCFPVRFASDTEPDVPDDTEDLREAADKLWARNEQKADAGFFPVGPYGEHRLWHGGIHLAGTKGEPVYAVLPGRVMAVRQGGTSGVGSTNFVLMRHDLTVGDATIRFFSLYFHLSDESGGDDVPVWMQGDSWNQNKTRGRVALIDEPLKGRDVVGHIGLAGPDRKPQFHFEIFAAREVAGEVQKNVFTAIDGTAGGRFSMSKQINDAIDTNPKDGQLSRRELLDFFSSNSDSRLARYYATLHVSEWIDSPSWTEALSLAAEFKNVKSRDIEQLVADQITPTLWWDDRVAKHAKLPRDGVVYHYNPIAFVKFINEKLQEANILADVGLGAFDEKDAKEQPPDVLGDIDDVDGDSFVDESELKEEDFGQDLTLEDLASGFPE